ncbi:MAG: hypothetical protein H7838_13075 [Magnetococcus sp. DMHC-8]
MTDADQSTVPNGTTSGPTLDLTPLARDDLPGRLPALVATHHPKLGHTRVDISQAVLCLKTTRRDPSLTVGICSQTIDTPYGLGALPGGKEVAVSMALACDLGQDRPASVLGGLLEGRNVAQLDEAVWTRLKTAFDQLQDRAPATLTRFERLVFFEGDDEEILLTPIVSLKLVHELNRRLHERNERHQTEQTAEATPPTRRIRQITLPIGGKFPHNAGYIVNKTTRNTRHGGIPLLVVACPEDNRSDPQRLLARLGASGSYLRIAEVGKEALRAYGQRAVLQIELASHRQAEERQAREIALSFVEQRQILHPLLEAMPPLNQLDPWRGMHRDELGWLDPRNGPFDRTALAVRFGREVRGRIERLLNARRDGQAADSPFVMPDRSARVLTAMFEEIL